MQLPGSEEGKNMESVDLNEQDGPPAGSKPWQAPRLIRFATAGAEAGDSGGGVDGDSTKS
jgi:hypothetical protein